MQLVTDYTLEVGKRLPHERAAGDEYDVVPWLKTGMHGAYSFTKKTAHPVSDNRFPQPFAGDKAIAVMIETVVRHAQRHPSMVNGPAFAAQALEVLTGPESVTLLHSRGSVRLARVPVDLFHVDTRHRQLVPTTETTRLKHATAVLGLHTLTEAVHTRATANFWLVCTLC